MTAFFVTGTDTGVGKTFVTAAIALAARRSGRTVFAFKPIETGCLHGELGADQQVLWEASGGWQAAELKGIYRLRRPVAPYVAAREEGVEIDVDHVLRTVAEGRRRAEITLVEGAGGWRVPVTREHDMASLAQRLAMPIIVVARATLGTINHTLLTVEAVERDRCEMAAVVLSCRPGDDLSLAHSNASEIRAAWRGSVVLLEGDDRVLDMFHVERS